MNKINIVIIGSGAVGKTSIIKQICHNSFEEDYDPTLEEEYDYEIEVEGKREVIHIIYTAGQ